jgi:immunity protein Imm1 of predicted polymorphic toxin system
MAEGTTKRLHVEYGESAEQTTVDSVADLDALLDRLDAEAKERRRPALVTLFDDARHYLAVGVGGDQSVLSWDVGTDDSESVWSRGSRREEGEVAFAFSNQFSFFPISALIDSTLAREAARQFFLTRQRPTLTEWQEF